MKNGGTTDRLHGTYYRNHETSTDKTGYVPTWDNYEKVTHKVAKNENIEWSQTEF
jgi:sulfur relay (sulfurtransferase) DsrC/TusE family protein